MAGERHLSNTLPYFEDLYHELDVEYGQREVAFIVMTQAERPNDGVGCAIVGSQQGGWYKTGPRQTLCRVKAIQLACHLLGLSGRSLS